MAGGHLDLVSEPAAQGAEIDEINGQEQLRVERDEANNRALRALADLENYRARVNRQMAEERMYANMDLVRDILPVWDNIGRTVEAVDAAPNFELLVEGVKMVHIQLSEVLKKYHCVRIEAKFKQFDPNYHESVAQIPNAEYPANTVIEEVQPGFCLFDRVVRPSQVVLASSVEQ